MSKSNKIVITITVSENNAVVINISKDTEQSKDWQLISNSIDSLFNYKRDSENKIEYLSIEDIREILIEYLNKDIDIIFLNKVLNDKNINPTFIGKGTSSGRMAYPMLKKYTIIPEQGITLS